MGLSRSPDRPVSMADGLIAATAKVRGWTVVTCKTKDFDTTGVRLLNLFSDCAQPAQPGRTRPLS